MFYLLSAGVFVGCRTIANDSEFSSESFEDENTMNGDGTYMYNGYIYKYKIKVPKIKGEAGPYIVVLTNNLNITYEEITHDLSKANMDIGVPEYVYLEFHESGED